MSEPRSNESAVDGPRRRRLVTPGRVTVVVLAALVAWVLVWSITSSNNFINHCHAMHGHALMRSQGASLCISRDGRILDSK